jgi:spore maturation protein CgeB
VLAFGEVIRDRYVARGWARRAWTWHEAADIGVFSPRAAAPRKRASTESADADFDGDLVWVGNWGDDERSHEIREFLIEPVKRLGIQARVHGVRYPSAAQLELTAAGIAYAGWLPNYCVPEVFARFKLTVHIPRRPYVSALPGIPTIRMFEALACGIPLVSCAWHDAEGLFRTGADYLSVQTPEQMTAALREVLQDRDLAAELASSGLETILARHTCAHRVDQLLSIAATIHTPLQKALTV